MRKIILACLIFPAINIYAQNAYLEATYTEPRVGEETELTITTANVDSIPQATAGFSYIQPTIALATLKLSGSLLSDTGIVTILPITIAAGNKIYTTDTFTVHVNEALPEVSKGIWCRVIRESNGSLIFIVEQYCPYEPIQDGNTTRYDYSNVKFANLKVGNFSNQGTEVIFYGSTSTGTNIKGQDVAVMRTNYKITFKSKNEKPIAIAKSDFENFPKGVKFKEVIIAP